MSSKETFRLADDNEDYETDTNPGLRCVGPKEA